jgi:DNA-binding NtrC family response regulator
MAVSKRSEGDADATLPAEALASGEIHSFRLVGHGRTWEIASPRCSIGLHPSNDVMLDDRTVSRFHCEILLEPAGARVRDLESRNGTLLDGVRVLDAYLRPGSELRLGQTTLRFEQGGAKITAPTSDRSEMGELVGSSPAMRAAFALLERAAQSDTTVLIEGETGTGKEGAAAALHAFSPRHDKPLIVVDCAALPANLMESELFGHEKGSFTGAQARRVGAFEDAEGGTVFLDEIGELSLDLQPKLLRVLERKEIRRVGTNAMTPIDVRVVAATHRDLRAAVNRGTFRPDLYFRLSVVRIPLPPLRQRLQDIPLLVERLLERMGARPEVAAGLRTPEFLGSLQRASWPGNVRELRNFVERCIVFQQPLPLDEGGSEQPAAEAPAADGGSFADARQRAIDDFERRFVTGLLARHGGKVSAAAQEAGVGRAYLYRLMQKHRLAH